MEKKKSKSRKVSSGLTVAKAPGSFAPMARAHNKLVKLIREMVGTNGIKVTTSEGKIIIEGAALGTEGAAISVVGSDGKLNLVPKHSTWATPTTYPTVLRIDNGAGEYISLAIGGGGPDIIIHGTTHELSVKEDACCDSGAPALRLILASDPY